MVNTLQIQQSVGNILRVTNIVNCHFQVTASASQDAVDEIAQGGRITLPVFFEPLLSNKLRRIAGCKDVGWKTNVSVS